MKLLKDKRKKRHQNIHLQICVRVDIERKLPKATVETLLSNTTFKLNKEIGSLCCARSKDQKVKTMQQLRKTCFQ